jgi:hypothetical protein
MRVDLGFSEEDGGGDAAAATLAATARAGLGTDGTDVDGGLG